ncbi:hypothetical protein Ddye_028720 [Dipteronia dyeriana]|uniref:Uncharacterized protein n=1 Tax=Dipteronia dyeriana TaxID=168575 RepID=A0AAD9TDU0_9ROSI|nr:hypothetical protein Ddye_028720 [Dipteronia dyeriana]
MAFAAKLNDSDANKKTNDGTKGLKKDRPYCTQCKFHGHTIDRCFKIHGYPPCYKQKPCDNIPSNITRLNVLRNTGACFRRFRDFDEPNMGIIWGSKKPPLNTSKQPSCWTEIGS